MKKIVAWCVLALVCWGAASAVKSWSSPWSMTSIAPTSPVLSHLPPAHTGCGDKCRYD